MSKNGIHMIDVT